MNCLKAPWNCASPHLDTTTRALLMEAEASDTRTLVDYREVEDARSSVIVGYGEPRRVLTLAIKTADIDGNNSIVMRDKNVRYVVCTDITVCDLCVICT